MKPVKQRSDKHEETGRLPCTSRRTGYPLHWFVRQKKRRPAFQSDLLYELPLTLGLQRLVDFTDFFLLSQTISSGLDSRSQYMLLSSLKNSQAFRSLKLAVTTHLSCPNVQTRYLVGSLSLHPWRTKTAAMAMAETKVLFMTS